MPVDVWVDSNLESMQEAVLKLQDQIKPGESWRVSVEKRCYTLCRKIGIIKELAELVDEKVDLRNPDKIARIDIIGNTRATAIISEVRLDFCCYHVLWRFEFGAEFSFQEIFEFFEDLASCMIALQAYGFALTETA